jgi:hypothetical protein
MASAENLRWLKASGRRYLNRDDPGGAAASRIDFRRGLAVGGRSSGGQAGGGRGGGGQLLAVPLQAIFGPVLVAHDRLDGLDVQ